MSQHEPLTVPRKRDQWDEEDDDTEPMPGEVRIRKPWDWPRDVAIRRVPGFWPEALMPRHTPRIQPMCSHCGENPAALAEWRPWHPIYDVLCVTCRVTVYRMASRTAVRTRRDMRAVLDQLMVALALIIN